MEKLDGYQPPYLYLDSLRLRIGVRLRVQFSLDCAGKVNVATPRLPKNDPRRDALEKMLEENQPAKVIYTSSAFGQWLRHVDSISPTVPQDTIPADEFWSGRSYVTGDFEATITHLIGKAEGYAGGEVEQGREAVIVIGPPASGKSTLAATHHKFYF